MNELNGLEFTPYSDVPETESANITDLELPDRVEVLTAEINIYKAQAGASIIEIGKRLTEAKGLLQHGQWLPWLEDGVQFSERQAQNFMRVAEEYSNTKTFADLGYSKALALLALGPFERDGFLNEKHGVDGQEKTVDEMSVRELQKAIRERDEALKAQKEAKEEYKAEWEKNDELGNEMEELREKAETAREKLEKAKTEAKELADQLDEQMKVYDVDISIEKEKAAAAAEALAKAKEAKKKADERYKTLKENPAADPEVLEKLKAEAEQAAKAAAEGQASERLKKIEAESQRLANERDAAAKECEAAEARAADLEKQLSMADPAVNEFKIYFTELQETCNKLTGLLLKIGNGNAEMGAKLKTALLTVFDAQREKAAG